MSNDKTRYKIGDELKATLIITGTEDYEGVEEYHLTVKGLIEASVENCYNQDELDQVFNPVIIKRKLQNDLDRITKQLEEMNNNEQYGNL